MSKAGFEPTISAGERPYTYDLGRATTGTGILQYTTLILLSSIRTMKSFVQQSDIFLNDIVSKKRCNFQDIL
jgi:hypothetical protein